MNSPYEIGELYWYVTSCKSNDGFHLSVEYTRWEDSEVDYHRYFAGCCYATEKEANKIGLPLLEKKINYYLLNVESMLSS